LQSTPTDPPPKEKDGKRAIRVDIWHNVLWSRYKGDVFSALWHAVDRREFLLKFTQIAETDADRAVLSEVELARHRYPFDLLFRGPFQGTTLGGRVGAILPRSLRTNAELTILSGYERLDCWLQLLVLKLRRKKAALFLDSTINDRPQTRINGMLKRLFFTSVDGIFGYGTRTKEYAVHYGARPDRVFIPCQAAALPADYRPEVARQQRVRSGVTALAPRFLYVGRLSAEKGLETLIDAFGFVRQRSPAAVLALVGEGQMRGALEEQAARHGLGSAVQFLGSKAGAALFSEFTHATALILPSFSEPWGLVVNEALAFGCPVVVSDRCGCVPELVIPGKTGLLHRAQDAQDLAEKMLSAPTLFEDLEATAEECLQLMSRYTPDRAASRILEGMRQILGRTAAT
jgi:glycosyltransferase involved in cell wall biosynthesis